MKPAERPLQEDYLSMNNSFNQVQIKEAIPRKTKARRLKSNRKTASAMKSNLNEIDSEGETWNHPEQQSPPRVIHQNHLGQPVAAKASKTKAPSPNREPSVSYFAEPQNARSRDASPAVGAACSALRESQSVQIDDPVLRQLTAATNARLESKIKKPDQACLRNDQQSEQQAGNLVKEPTLAQSRSSSTTGIMPSMHRKATSVTASPSKTRKAGPGDAERNMPKSIAQESSTAKKITIE